MTTSSSGISSPRGVRAAYEDATIAADYVDARFRHPLGALLHDAQVDAVLDAIGRERPARVLELAPGPARLSADVAAVFTGRLVLADASAAMLAEARRRLPPAARVRTSVVRADGFALPLSGPFDLAYSFRFVRHFDAPDRARLYAQIRGVLGSGRLFVFDAVNRAVAAPLRAHAAPGEYPIHDALLDESEIRQELDAAGFDLVALLPVQKRYALLHRLQVLVAPRSRRLALAMMRRLERLPGGDPLEWIVCARRRAER